MQPSLLYVSEEGFLKVSVGRKVIEVCVPGLCFELNASGLVTRVEQRAVGDHTPSEYQRGIVDDPHVGVANAASLCQLPFDLQHQLEPLPRG